MWEFISILGCILVWFIVAIIGAVAWWQFKSVTADDSEWPEEENDVIAE